MATFPIYLFRGIFFTDLSTDFTTDFFALTLLRRFQFKTPRKCRICTVYCCLAFSSNFAELPASQPVCRLLRLLIILFGANCDAEVPSGTPEILIVWFGPWDKPRQYRDKKISHLEMQKMQNFLQNHSDSEFLSANISEQIKQIQKT